MRSGKKNILCKLIMLKIVENNKSKLKLGSYFDNKLFSKEYEKLSAVLDRWI